MDDKSWTEEASELLEGARVAASWSYRAGGEPAVEPTALAGLALLAADEAPVGAKAEALEAGEWLARLQQSDGHLGPTPSLRFPSWPTALALLFWSAIDAHRSASARAVTYLLGLRGAPFARAPRSPFGHDTRLIGWPWSEGTHSWVEPTSLALLALCREGQRRHPRVEEGLRLLRDRQLASGGWNYGNTTVFGTELRAQPGPTGLALLALAAAGEQAEPERALAYLEKRLPGLRAPQSLALGVLGLRAWGRSPKTAGKDLERAFRASCSAADRALQAAYALLGAGPASLDLLGVHQSRERPWRRA